MGGDEGGDARRVEVGFDLDRIVEREVYSVPAMPVMYLLDRGGTVLLKDAFLPEIEARLIELS